MKKLILSLYFVAATILVATAQITITADTLTMYGPASSPKLEKSTGIKNLSSDPNDTAFTWKFISYSKVFGWQTDFCDPFQCYFNVNSSSTEDFDLGIGQARPMIGYFTFNGMSGNGVMTVVVTSKKNPSNADTLTFIGTSWTTAVKEINKAEKITAYPNPAKNSVFFSTKDIDANSIVKIYDLTGKEVMSVNLKGRMETEVDCSGLSNGMYIAKYTVNGNTAVQRLAISR